MNNKITDIELLDIYIVGFNDELWANPKLNYEDKLKQISYNEGRDATILGEDIRSVDYRTDQEILQIIKNKHEKYYS